MAIETAAPPSLVWFRQDLRLSDNPALAAAVDRGAPVIPVFIWAPDEEGVWNPGAPSRWWLHRSLAALHAELEKRGSRLILRRGPTGAALTQLLAESGASSVFWNRRYEPSAVVRDSKLKSQLRARGINAGSFNGNLLFEPGTIRNSAGQPFRVFTAFWKSCLAASVAPSSGNAPKKLRPPDTWPPSLNLSDPVLEPVPDSTRGLSETWEPGESSAKARLKTFREQAIGKYSTARDRPGVLGTSRLSPHLHFGEIGPGEVWRTVQRTMDDPAVGRQAACEAFLRQIAWREFAYHLLYHYPESPAQSLRSEFSALPWTMDPEAFRAWTRGETGYPLVDAGMRELWNTGWMHNRVRMVVASFLVKHLLIRWQEGAAWFWDTLVDADLANNTMGWQWAAGCGVDAAPFFRIFNPVVQGEKFDSAGDYVRRWVPELRQLPPRWIHAPWKAPDTVLANARITLGTTYPRPIVIHEEARERALAAFASAKTSNLPDSPTSTPRTG